MYKDYICLNSIRSQIPLLGQLPERVGSADIGWVPEQGVPDPAITLGRGGSGHNAVSFLTQKQSSPPPLRLALHYLVREWLYNTAKS